MNIKLEQYKIFNEAANTLSFSIAARNLFISQSAVSQTIRILENELNTQLFVRKSKGVILTRDGELLHSHIKQALELITDGENSIVQSHRLLSGELVIGAGDTFSENYLIPYIMAFKQSHPQIKIKLINRTSLETIELLKNGQLDFGFLNLPISDDSLEIKKCLEVHDIFVTNTQPDHLYTFKELASKDLILLEQNSNSRQYIDHLFFKDKIDLKPSMELGAHELLIKFAKLGLGISSVIKEFTLDELQSHELYEIPLKKPIPPRSIGYAYLKNRVLSPISIQFMESLK